MTALDLLRAPRSRPAARFLTDSTTALLRAEGAVAMAVGLGGFFALSGSWSLLGVTLLLPDLAMAGYLLGPKIGAWTYNAAHTYLAPALLAGLGPALGSMLPLILACVWVAHIGLDRALGYGLKRRTGFGETHLGSIGGRRRRRGDAAGVR